ncbi:helix-turn-helix transcriptional regulator [Streptomyces albireticuli]|nr:helix-turn-helix transcriptional regulator [Streptomyces albireticuli]MCD9143919.1 helix-turn-helix transcriptional regulator [Streptomyces albireticuli]MCD9161650.1 helix-turn-helix transcriptional regulator [Streptomyces albireticuli]MCD9192036.1 helix-turn-helix transcriptional regulator [Streptomyces albireticuli]
MGTELKRLRERADITANEAARLIGVTQSKMSNFESGRAAVSEDRLRKLADHYGESDAAFVDALAVMATEKVRGWWDEYKGVLPPALLDLAELEQHAERLRAFQVVHIPGLLQTAEHARALYSNNMTDMAPEAIEATVDFRVKRRKILDREAPQRLDVVIHEAALRIKVGDRKVALDQLRFILEMMDRPRLTVRVVPFEQDWFMGASFSMLYMEAALRRLDTVQIDKVNGSAFVDEEGQLDYHRRVLDAASGMALSGSRSRDLIHRIAQQL